MNYRLALMIFLQFFTWGTWYGQITKYLAVRLGASGQQQGAVFATFSLAMLVAPFFVGFVSDRYFSAQRVLAVLALAGSALLFLLPGIRDPAVFFVYMLVYCLTFTPTLALTTRIAMYHLAAPERQYPGVRIWGTVAWILVSNLIGYLHAGTSPVLFQIGGTASLLLGLFAWTLPDTPPATSAPVSWRHLAGVDAFALLSKPGYGLFFAASVLICLPLSFYYAMANPALTDGGLPNVESTMSLGQVSEAGFLLLLPLAYRKLGVKGTLVIALVAWTVRFLCFASGNVALFYPGILLHGICYDFFFVTGQLYTDRQAGPAIKTQAQSLLTFATYGVGMGLGSLLSGRMKDVFTAGGTTQWAYFWLVPAGVSAVILCFFLFTRFPESHE